MKRLFYLIPLLLTSCIESITMDSIDDMPIVVKCVLTRDQSLHGIHAELEDGFSPPVQYLDLYYAKKSSTESYEKIKDAKVTINGYKFEWNGSRWQCSFLPLFDKKYTLIIETADGKKLSSYMTFPSDCYLNRYRLIEYSSLDVSASSLASYYYIVRHYDNNNEYNQCAYKVFNGACNLWIRALDNGIPVEKICTSHPGVDNFNVINHVWGDCIVFDYFHNNFNNLASMLSNPPTFLTPLDVDPEIWNRYSDKMMRSPLYAKVLRINHPENYDSGMNLSLDHYIASTPVGQPVDTRDLFVLGADFSLGDPEVIDGISYYPDMSGLELDKTYEIRFVSEEYDKYLKTIVDSEIVHKDELTTMYSPNMLYSNIEGGIGCFGGQWITYVRIGRGI